MSKQDVGNPKWKVGLVNHLCKYFTAETFGFKINASGATLRKKQQWTIEQDRNEEDTVYIISHLGKYLAGDQKGNATCESDSKGPSEKFTIVYCPDDSGRWAIANKTTGYFLGGTDEVVRCYEKQPGPSEWWFVHLAIHPQINLRNYCRQKYARLSNECDCLQVNEITPWGKDALITIEFIEGRYAVKSCDDQYLHKDGKMVDRPSPDTLFTLELKTGQFCGLALRDGNGKYLTAVGKDGVMQTRNKTAGKDEIFLIEDSQGQAYITAHNGKMISLKQGIDMTANQTGEPSDKEIFQIETDPKTKQCKFRTCENNYWFFESSSNGIQCVGHGSSANDQFALDWLPNGAISMRAANGKYVTARMNGSLFATSDSVTDKETFYLTIVNRPILVLRSEFGFVGFRTQTNPRYECNKTCYDIIFVEHPQRTNAEYFLKGHNGHYIGVDGEGCINADQAKPQPFFVELRGHSKMAIKTANGCYLVGEQNGIITAKGRDAQKGAMWEY